MSDWTVAAFSIAHSATAQPVLVALRVDTDHRDQDQIFVHVSAVDLDHQQIEARERTPSSPSCAGCPEADRFCSLPSPCSVPN
jgi:hypothetical protein